MAEAGRQERERCYKHSPLLGPRRNYGLASETSSLSESCEAPKSYGATRKPLQPPCDYKVVSYELLEGDTLQGIAIKFEVTVEDLKRVNKLWTNDNIHFYKTLKIPVKVDSQFNNEKIDLQSDGDVPGDIQHTSHSDEGANEAVETPKNTAGSAASTLRFLSSLDALIENSKQESEKLRNITGPKVLADLEKATEPTMPQDEYLFRPLPSQARGSPGPVLASSRNVRKSQTALKEAEEQFYEL